MTNIQDTLEMLRIADKIQNILDNKDEMTTSDYQGAIEAQVMIAYQLGIASKRI